MGYDSDKITIHLRLDNHLTEQTLIDRQAAEDLRGEIEALIQSTPAYKRIAITGVN